MDGCRRDPPEHCPASRAPPAGQQSPCIHQPIRGPASFFSINRRPLGSGHTISHPEAAVARAGGQNRVRLLLLVTVHTFYCGRWPACQLVIQYRQSGAKRGGYCCTHVMATRHSIRAALDKRPRASFVPIKCYKAEMKNCAIIYLPR